MTMTELSIELDCPPGWPRPQDLIENVIAGTGLAIADFETGAPFFGCQKWVLRSDAGKEDVYVQQRPLIKQRVEALYHNQMIRYGSW